MRGYCNYSDKVEYFKPSQAKPTLEASQVPFSNYEARLSCPSLLEMESPFNVIQVTTIQNVHAKRRCIATIELT